MPSLLGHDGARRRVAHDVEPATVGLGDQELVWRLDVLFRGEAMPH